MKIIEAHCAGCGVERNEETCYVRVKPNGRKHLSDRCKKCKLAYEKQRYQKNPQQKRLDTLRRKYSLSEQELFALNARAKGACEICLRPFTQSPNVDHCHCTKKVRGLLCANCNTLLGLAHDSVSTLASAIQYLSKYGGS